MSETIFNVNKSVTGKKWIERKSDPIKALQIKQSYQVSEIVSRIIVSRDQTIETTDDFLEPTIKKLLPDPSHLKDMDIALERVKIALNKGEKIAVFGDYDVDGATSSALLFRFFKMVGIAVEVYIPDRVDEGYGPNEKAFDKLKNKGILLVITVDCGTTSFEPLSYAKKIGLDVIVLDHHVGEPKLPDSIAVINPNRLDEKSNLKNLAAVGMSFVFVVGLNRVLRESNWYKSHPTPDILSLLDLVALGTVCDVMPLKGLNRAFVKQGLKVMSKRRNIGLKELSDISGINEKPSSYHLGFVLGPRINAGGRVGDAGLGSLLLRSDDVELCKKISEKLNNYNEERKKIEEDVLDQAILQAENQLDLPVIIVSGENWHPGVIGIVAGRLKESYNRPSCVIAFDENGIGKGSGRGVSGMDLGSMVHSARQKDIIESGGGHAMAAGFSLNKDKLKNFHDFLNEKMESFNVDSVPTLLLDGALSSKAVNIDLIKDISKLEPYGIGNPSPKFALGNLRLVKSIIVGQHHIKCIFKQLDGTTLDAIAFRCVDKPMGDLLLKKDKEPIHIAGSLNINSWMGNDKPQVIIEDVATVIN